MREGLELMWTEIYSTLRLEMGWIRARRKQRGLRRRVDQAMGTYTLQVGTVVSCYSTLASRRHEHELISLDERALPPAGRIGETEDLIGSVFVEDGKVSYLRAARWEFS